MRRNPTPLSTGQKVGYALGSLACGGILGAAAHVAIGEGHRVFPVAAVVIPVTMATWFGLTRAHDRAGDTTQPSALPNPRRRARLSLRA